MKIHLAIPILIVLALNSSLFGPVYGQIDGSRTGYGKAFLVGTVDVRGPQPHTISSGEDTNLQLNSGVKTGPSHHSTGDPPRFGTPSNGSVVTSSFGFDGINAIQGGGFTPPDVQVAAGPNYLVEMVNVLGTIYTRQGGLVRTLNLHQLFNAPNGLSDPKVLFDSPSQRWFASIITSSSPHFLPGNVTVAISTNGDPFTWNLYNLCPGQGGTCPSKAYLPDQPILGVSDDKVTISVNDFGSTGFAGAQYWILNKSEMTSGARSVDMYTHGPDSRYFSIHPVQSLSSTTTEYMVSVGNCCTSNVTLFSITGVPPGSVANSTVSLPISTLTSPPNGVQPATPSTVGNGRNGDQTTCQTSVICTPPSPIDLSSSNRVQSAIWFKGILWYAANDGCTPPGDSAPRSCVRLTQINTGTTRVTQDFDYVANATYYFYPTLSMDGSGNLDVIYGYSSSTTFPSLAITGQSIVDLPATLAPAVTIKKGVAPNTSGRYGDYFGAGVDPANTAIVWVAGEYGNQTNGAWATFIANMSLKFLHGYSTMSTNPSSVTIFCNVSGCDPAQNVPSNLTITSVNGFLGTVGLTYVPPSSNCCTTLTGPSSANVPLGGSVTVTIIAGVLGTKSGTYVWTIDGTGGGFSTSTTLTVVYDFCAHCL